MCVNYLRGYFQRDHLGGGVNACGLSRDFLTPLCEKFRKLFQLHMKNLSTS